MGPANSPDTLRVTVDGAELGCVRWRGRPGSPFVVAVHGITANAWSWGNVAHHLNGEVGLVAIDLRGRGASNEALPPFGMRGHADDVAAVIARLGTAPAVITGHSMGAHVALMCAERHPAAVASLVLVDGGPPIDRDDELSSDAMLDEMLGPAIERLRKVWPDRVTYHAMWSAHPAFAGGLTLEMERYLLSDLVDCEGGFRSNVSEDAVRFDGGELLSDDEVRGLFARARRPPHRGSRRDRPVGDSTSVRAGALRRRVSRPRLAVRGRQQPLLDHVRGIGSGRDRRRAAPGRRRDRLRTRADRSLRSFSFRSGPPISMVGLRLSARPLSRPAQLPVVIITSAPAASAIPVSWAEVARSPSITEARQIVLAGYIATTTATTDSKPSRVDSR